jgi:hypothetical protein
VAPLVEISVAAVGDNTNLQERADHHRTLKSRSERGSAPAASGRPAITPGYPGRTQPPIAVFAGVETIYL